MKKENAFSFLDVIDKWMNTTKSRWKEGPKWDRSNKAVFGHRAKEKT